MKKHLRTICSFLFMLIGTMVCPTGSGMHPALAAETRPEPVQAVTLASPLPLPHDCEGITPPGVPPPPCCVYGYVYYGGVPVAGASVRIESPYGALDRTTDLGGASDEPYYHAGLSSVPLFVSPGDTITVTAAYQGNSASTAYEVASGGQQVDVVIPINPLFGDGMDGDLDVTGTHYTDNVRAALDSTASAGQNALSVTSTSGFAVGDEVLVVQVQGTGVGNDELGTVQGIGSGSLLLEDGLQHTYTVSGSARAQVLRVPHYRNVTVESGGVVTAHPWDGSTGGIVAFRASGRVQVRSGGQIDVTGRGYRSPAPMLGGPSVQQCQGEGFDGPGAPGPDANTCGGGGGRNESGHNAYDEKGAGGGGHATPGGNSASGYGRGGSTFGQADLSRSLTFGGAGGVGGIDWQNGGGGKSDPLARNGGGIVLIYASDLQVSGSIAANGGNGYTGGPFDHCEGGGGAGGSVRLVAQALDIGASKVTATGGVHSGSRDDPAGDGGLGRIAIDYCQSLIGSTDPPASVRQGGCNVAPLAIIHKIFPRSAIQGRDVVTFRGSAVDGDQAGASIEQYVWYSDLDGLLSTQDTFTRTASTLTPGTHAIYFKARDDEGDWSEVVSVELRISVPGSWRLTAGSLATPRYDHGIALLQDGTVLVTGGRSISPHGALLASSGRYDHDAGRWSPTGSLNAARFWFGNLVALQDGRVLIAGGTDVTGYGDFASAELYDPATGTWSLTGSLNTARRSASLTLLADGRVLIAGGAHGVPDGNRFLASCELYDPATGTWTYTGRLHIARDGHIAARLLDGRVLIAGGEGPWWVNGQTAEIYDPATGTWSTAGSMDVGHAGATMTVLADGRVLVAGGLGQGSTFHGIAELYDPVTGTWARTGSLQVARAGHTASRLSDGRVLIVGGNDLAGTLRSTEIYDPETGTWSLDVDLQVARSAHQGVTLPGGIELVVGGYGTHPAVDPLASSEVYSIGNAQWITSTARPWLFMLYLDGDNNLQPWLERALVRLEESANPDVHLLALVDGAGRNDTWLYDVQPGGNYLDGTSRWHRGELDMGDPQTLAGFVTWAREHYTATHTYLAIADHGRGTTGIAWDDTSGQDQLLTVAELRTALQEATLDGLAPLDVVHYDACLMAMIENAYQIKDYAHYLVASQNLGWSVFAYDLYAAGVTKETTPRDLAVSIADRYYHHPSLAGHPRTISALDLGQAGAAAGAVSALATALQADLDAVKVPVSGARDDAQKFDSRNYYAIDDDDEYLDLYDLARLIREKAPGSAVQDAAQGVMDAVSALVIAEHHESGTYQDRSWDLEGAHGVSIYFPPAPGGWDYGSYMGHAFRFTAEGTWDEFLIDYFGVVGMPPDKGENPGLPPMLDTDAKYTVYLPAVVKDR